MSKLALRRSNCARCRAPFVFKTPKSTKRLSQTGDADDIAGQEFARNACGYSPQAAVRRDPSERCLAPCSLCAF